MRGLSDKTAIVVGGATMIGQSVAETLVGYGADTFTVGVFVQANFGRRPELTLAGVPFGLMLAGDNPMAGYFASEHGAQPVPPGSGSVIAIVGTDAPLLPHQCQALARRVTLGLARTGTTGSHFSGDLFLAFSTANPGGLTAGPSPAGPGHYDQMQFVPWNYIDPFYEAVVQATEEAVANALVANEDMTGRDGHRSPALPRDRVAAVFRDRPDPLAPAW